MLDTHERLLSGKFQKNSFMDSFFMDDSRVQNGRFRPKMGHFSQNLSFLTLESAIKNEHGEIKSRNFAKMKPR